MPRLEEEYYRFTDSPLLLPIILFLFLVKVEERILNHLHYTIAMVVIVDVHVEQIGTTQVALDCRRYEFLEASSADSPYVPGVFCGWFVAETSLPSIAGRLL